MVDCHDCVLGSLALAPCRTPGPLPLGTLSTVQRVPRVALLRLPVSTSPSSCMSIAPDPAKGENSNHPHNHKQKPCRGQRAEGVRLAPYCLPTSISGQPVSLSAPCSRRPLEAAEGLRKDFGTPGIPNFPEHLGKVAS